MKNIITIIILLFLSLTIRSYGQIDQKKNYFPIWTFHQDSLNIHGVSLGLWTLNGEQRFTNTNGIKLELIGVGMFIVMFPGHPIAETDSAFKKLQNEPLSERINGLNLSLTGADCHCSTNGVAAGLLGQINFQVNGISSTYIMNFAQKHNGIMTSVLFCEAYYMNGLQVSIANTGKRANGVQIGIIRNKADEMNGVQIGLFNSSGKLRGFQLGIWNKNEKRALPLVNWNFND